MVETLRRRGYLGDAELAMQYVVARATRLGHGPLRLQRDLEQRGIDASVAQRAWQQAVEQGDVDPETLLGRAVERRLGGSALQGPGNYRRVYNALIRAGFDPHDVRAALAPHRAFEDGEDDFDA